MSPNLAASLIAELDDTALDTLALLLAPRLAAQTASDDTGWLDLQSAATHLACPPSRIYALVSARRIPFHKDGSRLLFDRRELNQWVRNGGATRP